MQFVCAALRNLTDSVLFLFFLLCCVFVYGCFMCSMYFILLVVHSCLIVCGVVFGGLELKSYELFVFRSVYGIANVFAVLVS